MSGQQQPRLSLLDKLLTNNGFGSLGKALRDSILNAFGSRDDTPQDVFTVFEYRHVHRHDWSKLKSAAIQRWRKVTARVFPETSPQATGIEDDDPTQAERPSWETEPELKLRTYPYMIFPLALHKLMWDYLIIGLVAFSVLELPMTIAFGSEACDEQAHAEEAGLAPPAGEIQKDHCKARTGSFDVFMDIMFWLDIVLTFRTGVIDNRQVIHMKPRFAALHYMRTWLLVDVVSSFPFDALVYATSTQSASATFLLARLFKLPRLMRTARILKNFRHLSKTTLFQIIYMLFCTFTLTHWAGCGFYFLARWQIKYLGANDFTGGLTWGQVPVSALEPYEGYVSADFKTKYSAALYWATTTMSTTGYGDILPMTNWERSYALCVMLVGVVLSALVFGVLAQIITEAFDHLPTGAQHQNEVKNKLQAFIADMKLDSHLTRKLQEALQLHFHLHGGVCLSSLLSTAEVSRNIREDVLMYAHGNRLQTCRMFQGCSMGWFRTFVQYIEPAVALEGEAVFAENDLPTHLSFVQSGLQLPKDGPGAPHLQVVPPEALGEYAVVQSKPHEYTATAETDCEVLSILHSDLVRMLQIFKEDAVTITHTVTAEHKRILRAMSGDRTQGREPGNHVEILEDHIRSHRQVTGQHRSTKGIAWEDRRQDLSQKISAMRVASATGVAGRKMRVSQGLSRCDSTHVDEDFTLLLDTLEELSRAQAAMCSKLVKFAASHT